MSDSWNVPSRSNNCSISMLIEKPNAILPLCHSIFFPPFPIFSPNVHIATELNGTIMITFSMHSVVNVLSPFTVSQMPQPPFMDSGFSHKFRFSRVRNRIIEVMNANANSFLNLLLRLNSCHHVTIAAFHPLPALVE